MRAALARRLVRLYPRRWRARYGAEFAAHLEGGGSRLMDCLDVALGALREHVAPVRGGAMDSKSESFGMVLRRPSAFLPVVMSLVALLIVLADVARHGVVREADEGTTAHLWQLLMAGQLPVLLWFAATWLRRAPRTALEVMALQAGGVLAAMAPVFLLKL